MSDARYNARWIATVMARTKRAANGCLEYTGFLDHCGYAQKAYRGKSGNVVRRLYQLVKGITLGSEQRCCHRCDNRACIDVEHIFIGTQKDNQRDMANKGRANGQWKTHCKRGHPLSGDNLYRQPKTGLRGCKACSRARMRILAGWPTELAYSMGPVPHGQRPVNAKKFRQKRAA